MNPSASSIPAGPNWAGATGSQADLCCCCSSLITLIIFSRIPILRSFWKIQGCLCTGLLQKYSVAPLPADGWGSGRAAAAAARGVGKSLPSPSSWERRKPPGNCSQMGLAFQKCWELRVPAGDSLASIIGTGNAGDQGSCSRGLLFQSLCIYLFCFILIIFNNFSECSLGIFFLFGDLRKAGAEGKYYQPSWDFYHMQEFHSRSSAVPVTTLHPHSYTAKAKKRVFFGRSALGSTAAWLFPGPAAISM